MINLRIAHAHEVRNYLTQNIPHLTKDQKQEIVDLQAFDESDTRVVFCVKDNGHVPSKLARLSIVFYAIVALALLLFIPIKWLFTGRSRYGYKKLNWFRRWHEAIFG